MSEDEYRQLVESMRESGFDETYPIVLYEGQIIDGRHRYQAALEAGVDPIFVEWYPKDGDTPERFAMRSNVRRHMTVSQRAAYAVAMMGDKATIKEMSEVANVSPTTISKAKMVAEERPEMIHEIIEGEVTMEEAIREIVPPKRQPTPKPMPEPVDDDQGEIDAPILTDDERDIEERLRAAFKIGAEFKSLCKSINMIAARLEEISKTDEGHALKMSPIKVDLKNVRDAIKWAIPFKKCPYPSHEGCKACKGKGWVIENVYNNIPEEIRK